MSAHEKYVDMDKQYRDGYFSNHLQSLCIQNKWTFIDGYPIRVKNYYPDKDGLVYAMKTI